MDEFASVDAAQGVAVPAPLQALFNDAGQVRVQKLPCALPGLDSKVVHFAAGARTNPHRHTEGQHIIIVSGAGVVGDESGVRVVRTGDVITSPPGGWHWHGALPTQAMSHVTVENPGLDLEVERRDWADVYTADLGG